jgi:LacI family transcriptional regulator
MAQQLRRSETPTLKTIARLSGLAVATVSRALGDAPDISADTKLKVRKIADEIGYIPNRAGVRLRTGRTNVISLILPVETNMANHQARLLATIAQELRGTQFHLNMTPLFDDEDPLKPVRNVVENGLADGIIINSTRADDARVRYMMDRNFPFATHGRTQWCDRHAYFDFDNFAFVRLAARHLYDLGRRHIKIILPPPGLNYSNDMVRGLDQARQDLGIPIQAVTGIHGDMSAEDIGAWAYDFLKTHTATDGIIVTSPIASMSVVDAVERLGLNLGHDIDLFTREAIPFLKLFRPQIHLIREDVGWVGTNLARAIIQAIRDPDAPPLQGLEVPTQTHIF